MGDPPVRVSQRRPGPHSVDRTAPLDHRERTWSDIARPRAVEPPPGTPCARGGPLVRPTTGFLKIAPGLRGRWRFYMSFQYDNRKSQAVLAVTVAARGDR